MSIGSHTKPTLRYRIATYFIDRDTGAITRVRPLAETRAFEEALEGWVQAYLSFESLPAGEYIRKVTLLDRHTGDEIASQYLLRAAYKAELRKDEVYIHIVGEPSDTVERVDRTPVIGPHPGGVQEPDGDADDGTLYHIKYWSESWRSWEFLPYEIEPGSHPRTKREALAFIEELRARHPGNKDVRFKLVKHFDFDLL